MLFCVLHLHDIWYLFHRRWNPCPTMSMRQMCPLLSCYYQMQLLCPTACLVWMGQTLNMLLLVKWCNFSQKCDKKSYRIAFFLFLLCIFYHFSLYTPQMVCQNYLGTKSTFTAAQKLTPSQFCSNGALNKAIFPKKHAIVVSFLSCFSGETQISCWWYITVR